MTFNLSIVVPAYNESLRLRSSLEKITKLKTTGIKYQKSLTDNNSFLTLPGERIEIIVVDDGSNDSTAEIIGSFSQVKKVSYSPNRGKGYALRQGVKKASGEYIYICDADLSTPIDEVSKFLKYIKDYDCVVGSRAAKGAREESSFFRTIMGKLGNKLIKFALDLDINDTQCGFKMFNRKAAEIFLKGEINRWGYDFELLVDIKQAGLKTKEIPVYWVHAQNSKVKLSSYFSTLNELYKVWRSRIGFRDFTKRLLKKTQSLRRYIIVGLGTNLFNLIGFYYFNKNNFFNSLDLGFTKIADYQLLETFMYIITVIMNFSFHKIWSFESKGLKVSEIKKYIFLLVFNYLVGLGIITTLVELFDVNVNWAKVVALGFIICWNYFALKFFVYGNKI